MTEQRFMWEPGDVRFSPCAWCQHYRGNAQCAAFVETIPDAILRNTRRHDKPYPNDNGIRFEPIEPEDPLPNA